MRDEEIHISKGQGNTGGSPLVTDVAEWLADQALGNAPVSEIVQGCAERLLAAGLPLWRCMLGYRTLHPLFASITLIWKRGEKFEHIQHPHENVFNSEEWLKSPMHYLLERRLPFMRRHLLGEDALLDFDILKEIRDQGGTDYLLFIVPFVSEGSEIKAYEEVNGVLGSWVTDRAGGFTDQDILDLKRIQRRLAVACKVQIKHQIARNVLTTYLGMDAGDKVLDGQIHRGDGELIHAVMWYSDMRDSTPLANELSNEEFLALGFR